MIDKQITLDKLNAFRKRDKFSAAAWEKRGLNPSDSEICNTLQQLFNDCADCLIEAIETESKPKQVKRILKSWLNSVNSSDYDTEEREFICDYFEELAKLVSVDINADLNSWLYGTVIGVLFKIVSFFKRKEKIIETLSQDCTQCGSALETFITAKEIGIPDYSFTIIQCSNCQEYNLLSIGPDVKGYRIGNYTFIEQLPKSEYTEEQANIRLEQIKYFRSK